MNKDLPKVYASPINHELRNNKDISYSSSKETRSATTDENIPKKINEIFASPNHVYKSRVHIITDEDEFDTILVGKTGDSLLTLKGEKISIPHIKNIEKI